MKLLKLGAFSVVFLFLIITFIGLLFPSKVVVSRTVDISQPTDSVYILTKDLFGWQKWVQGLQTETIAAANKTKLGNSTIVITAATPQEISGKWIEKNGDEQLTSIKIIHTEQNKTIVNWQFEQQIKWYPWARLSSMVNETVIGKMMEDNLASLKRVAEQAK